MPEQVGLVGVGRMGAAMARRLRAAGHQLWLRDVSETALAPFRAEPGVAICASPREVAEQVSIVLLSLPLPRALEEVVFGPDGLLEARATPCVVDLSTSGVAASRRVAAALATRGLAFLDAPVSGGVPGAEKGTLSVMVAGDPALHARFKPLLATIGKNVFYVGREPGQGQAMKLVNNILSATALVATAEAMVVATKAGIPPAVALDILNVSSGRNSATQDKFPKDVITGTFAYGFTTEGFVKDVSLFAELAQELAVPMLVSPAVVNAWRFAVARGLGPQDVTAITRLFERWAGVEVRDQR